MNWDDALAEADASVAGYFDTQPCRAVAMRRPARDVNGLPEPDPGRAAFDFMATIERDPGLTAIGTEGAASRGPGSRQAARTCLTALATAWPWMPRQGDQVESDGTIYRLAAQPDRDGSDRVVLWLNRNAG